MLIANRNIPIMKEEEKKKKKKKHTKNENSHLLFKNAKVKKETPGPMMHNSEIDLELHKVVI